MDNLFIGKNRLNLVEVDSTNTYAMNLLKNTNLPEGTLIYTENQTRGKGQRGSNWFSSSLESLTFSIILYPEFLAAEENFYLSKWVAVSLLEALTELTLAGHADIKIKWPNDIMLGGKKTGGVLIENVYRGDKITQSVIGIGLNLNQVDFPEWATNATSIKIATGRVFNKEEVLMKCLAVLERNYIPFKRNPKRLDEKYSNFLFLKDEWHIFSDSNGKFTGKINGVNKLGRLEVQKESGNVLNYEVKEIDYLL